MTQENPDYVTPEVKFAGEEKAERIKRGFAITTIRNPRPSYNFSQGQEILADCFESGEKVPVVVLACETKKLKDFSIPQLALDGFFSIEQVITEMKSYPGYEKIKEDSEITAVTFVDEKPYAALLKEAADAIYGQKLDDLIKQPVYRHLFFPTMCFNLAQKGLGTKKWIEFLKDYSLITPEEKREMEGHHYLGGLTASRLFDLEPEHLKRLSLHPNDPAFKPLILGIFE